MTKEKQDLINIYREYKKYKSENLFSLLYYHLSKYLTSLNILNKRTNDYEITFYINNKEYKLYNYHNMYYYTEKLQIFDKRKTINFNNEIELFEYIENKLLPEKDFKNE